MMFLNQNRFMSFVIERHRIYESRLRGDPAPWTKDPILAEWKFCNVYRELDRVTQWIRVNWRKPNRDDPDLWFAMVVARFINWPDTLAELGYPVPWNTERFLDVLTNRKHRREKIWTGAYMVRAGPTEGQEKAEYYKGLFDYYWSQRDTIRPKKGDTLNSWHMQLGMYEGFGSFMAAQIVADVKYVEPLLSATDWETFAASGPGSRRGLNRVVGHDVKAPWTEDDWRLTLARLRAETAPRFTVTGMQVPHAQDLQNCLCEFDKYERVRLGEGQPRSRFKVTGPLVGQRVES